MRDCQECGETFTPKTSQSVYCSHRCSSRAYVKRHPERRQASVKTAWEKLRADPERYEKFLAAGRESYARHPETAYLYAVEWRGKNREKVRERNRQQQHHRQRQTRRRQDVREYAVILMGDPCCYCGKPMQVLDHIEPIALGGLHDPDNLTAACRSCNAKKRSMTLLGFLLAQGGKLAASPS